jgi:hypothetical protein
MGEVIDLQGQPNYLENDELVADLCRFAEGILTEAQVKKKHRFNATFWKRLGKDDALVEKIEAEKIRRIRDGSSKREKSQLHVTKAPDLLSGIMEDVNANARHRIQAAEVLDRFSATGPGAPPPADRFQITIVLSADERLHFDKSIAVNPNDEPNDVVPQATITQKDDGGG